MTEQTVFIVDDDEAVRDSIMELVESVGLQAEAFASAQAFLEVYHADRAGCLVLDVRMARMSGLALQAKLNEIDAKLPIIFITGHGDIPMAVEALKAGAFDFIQKPYHEQSLLESINKALARDESRRAATPQDTQMAGRIAMLTDREREVLRLLVDGKSNVTIADELGISPRTVEIHRSRVLNKFQVRSVAQLVRIVGDAVI